jgi:hypothetical protein
MTNFLHKSFLTVALAMPLAAAAVEVTIDPAEGNVYTTIKDIDITFPEGSVIAQGTIDRSNIPEINGPERCSMWISGYSFTGNHIKFQLGQAGVKEPGDYVLSVPGVCYTLNGAEGEDLTFNYTIVASDKVKEYTITADESSLQAIEVRFPNVMSVSLLNADGVTLTNAAGDACTLSSVEVYSNYLLVMPDEAAVAADGAYTLHVAAGTVGLVGDYVNDAIESTFNVVHPDLATVALSPTAGEYTTLQRFVISALNGQTVAAKFTTAAHPYLLNADNDTIAETLSTVATGDSSSIAFKFGDEITDLGNYTLVVPAGCYTVDGEAGEEIVANYTIIADTSATAWTATPNGKETLTELTTIDIEFPNAASLAINSGFAPSLTDANDTAVACSWKRSGTTVTVTVNDEISNGTYTLKIESGAFTITDADDGEYTSFPITVVYTIDSNSGITTVINNSNTNNTIYNLQGIRLKAMPQSGVVILNGKKVVIR